MNDRPVVYVIDDDASARESLVALIASMGLSVKPFESAEEFLAASLPDLPGCVVTDLRMTGMSGLDLQEQLVEGDSALPVVLITAHASIPVAVKAVRAGAITCLEKGCSEHELWQAIKDALNKNAVMLKRKREREVVQGAMATLTDAEKNVLKLISEGNLNKQVARTLGLSLRAVEDRRRRVMQKLKSDSFAELMRFVVQAEHTTVSSSEPW